jgi:hypothetical protein
MNFEIYGARETFRESRSEEAVGAASPKILLVPDERLSSHL